MKHLLFNIIICFLALSASAQTGQVNIARIDQMPDLPAPLSIRDWVQVTRNYDLFVFNMDLTGTYLPLARLGFEGQFNYTDNTALLLDSYVGADGHLNQAEAINIMPAIIGASLTGIDKSNQNGINWVSMMKDFFNLKNGQNIYLNNYSATSGNDWWYDVMPNVYFYQLYSLYPNNTAEFSSQFTTVANRWLYCVNQLGGSTTPWTLPNMNYRAFNFATGLPLNTSVPEPESAGSIAWLLYNAYSKTGNRQYIEGAQLAMDYLAGLNSNPSYELQLPYGTLAAARMNAIEGTDYSIQKMLDWCFERGDLRGWGAIVGTWDGYDVSGLIGEANDKGDDYAFVMNGFQQAAALAPLPKYDKRYAKAIAKWILNVSNASRLFYWNALPESKQDSYSWASVYDLNACIPYESLKEKKQNQTPFATGDAIGGGWAGTNLSLYSGSSVGYLASVAKATNVSGILQIDLNKTDFYGDNSLIAYLYYNPNASSKQVKIDLPSGNYAVYETITESILNNSISGSFNLSIPAGEVRMIKLYAAGIATNERDGKLYAGDAVLDYHYRYDFSDNIRIKSISTDKKTITVNTLFNAYCEPGNQKAGEPVNYEWFLDDVPITGQAQVQIKAPSTPSKSVLKCRISANSQTAEDTLHLMFVEYIPTPPVVTGIITNLKYTITDQQNTFTAMVEPALGEILEYHWSASSGTMVQTENGTMIWQAPSTPTVASITVEVVNQDLLSTSVSVHALVKSAALTYQSPLIWYPFDADTHNAVADRFHATASGVTKTDDARGMTSLAYRFNDGSNIIYTENDALLNFTDAIGLSCWIKCDQLGSERFIISHGSWQQRYKLSITPEGHLRWTVKTSSGVTDLDSSAPIELSRFYHVTVIYTGYSMELYVDGNIDTFKPFSGKILTATKPLTIGRMDNVETLYAFRGTIDEVKVWDVEIPGSQIVSLQNEWETSMDEKEKELIVDIFPNPTDDFIHLRFSNAIKIEQLTLYNAEGRAFMLDQHEMSGTVIRIYVAQAASGLNFLRIILSDGQMIIRKIIIL